MSAERYSVGWLVPTPSPMLRAFLEAASRDPRFDLEVIHCASRLGDRVWNWNEAPGQYKARWLRGVTRGGFCFNPEIVAICVLGRYDFFVVTGYDQPTTQLAMATLSILRRNWAIAGERPGLNPGSIARCVARSMALFIPKHFASCGIGVGELAKNAYATLFNFDRRTYSIPYLVDLAPFLSLPRRDRSDGRVRFFFCGQLINRKGIDFLCDAAGGLLRRNTHASLLILGDGPERYRVERLSRLFPEQVSIRGFVPFDRRSVVFQEADILVLPSRHDGWGTVVHEAMASGLPVISSRLVGAAYDLVEHGVNGLLVDSLGAPQFLDAMEFFVANPDRIHEFGEAARKRASRMNISWGLETLLDAISGTHRHI